MTTKSMDPHTCTQITMCKNTFFVHRLPCGKNIGMFAGGRKTVRKSAPST